MPYPTNADLCFGGSDNFRKHLSFNLYAHMNNRWIDKNLACWWLEMLHATVVFDPTSPIKKKVLKILQTHSLMHRN